MTKSDIKALAALLAVVFVTLLLPALIALGQGGGEPAPAPGPSTTPDPGVRPEANR